MDLTHDPEVAYEIVAQHQHRLRTEAAALAGAGHARRAPQWKPGRSRQRIAGVLRHLAALIDTSSVAPRSAAQ